MKKILITIIVLGFVFIFSNNIKFKAEETFDDSLYTAGDAQYQVTERLANKEIDYGIKYINDIAVSKSTTQIGGTNTLDPQVVNYLEVPTSSVMKVVNWTYSSASGWTTQTLTKLAQDFEFKNPGWVVVAGINGDFFDINSNGALPKQTTGAAVNNGEVVRAVSSGRQVGFTNDGTTNSLIGGKTLSFTDYHTLTIYDESENVIGTYKIDKFNSAPTGDEISLYFSYYVLNDGKREVVTATTPSENSYLIENQERGYATNANQMYGRGIVSSVDKEVELYVGQFALVTENEEVQSLLEELPLVRIQQDIVGDYAECDNISGCGAQLVLNGEHQAASDGMSHYRHPRTVIGKKSDGSIVMVTVDGRQQPKGMYGMTYDELSTMMMYYGVEEAYNLDGGGSTTMIIRNDQGGFDVMNSPSDGGERHDANAIFVVVPEMKLYIDEVTDTTLEISYLSKCKNVNISNVVATVSTEGHTDTKEITSDKFLWEGLLPNSEYSLTFSYDLEYNGNTIRNTSKPMTFITGKARPYVTDYSYVETDTHYIFQYNLVDENKILISARIKYDRKSITINVNNSISYLEKSKVENPEFTLVLVYNVGATPNSRGETTYIIEKEVEPPHVHEFVEGECECGEVDPNYEPPHVHNFVEGKCECGEVDPNYEPPHVHNFKDGKCECGEVDPNYEPPHVHNFVEGKCECGEVDPNYEPPHVHNFVEGKCECGEIDSNYVAPKKTCRKKSAELLIATFTAVSIIGVLFKKKK